MSSPHPHYVSSYLISANLFSLLVAHRYKVQNLAQGRPHVSAIITIATGENLLAPDLKKLERGALEKELLSQVSILELVRHPTHCRDCSKISYNTTPQPLPRLFSRARVIKYSIILQRASSRARPEITPRGRQSLCLWPPGSGGTSGEAWWGGEEGAQSGS